MKNKCNKLFLLIASLMGCCVSIYAGGIKIKSGNLNLLKSEKRIKVVFDYSQLKMFNGELEEDYVAWMVNELNHNKNGEGDKWKGDWTGNRTSKFQPAFIKQFNKEAGDLIIATDSSECKYTLMVKVMVMNPSGYTRVNPNAYGSSFHYVMNTSAMVILECSVMEITTNSKSVCELQPFGAGEKGHEEPHEIRAHITSDNGKALTEAFERGGKLVGNCFEKNLK